MDRELTVILDDATPGRERLCRLVRPRGTIVARAPGEVADAFARIAQARAAGLHAAGYLSYELGLLLEPRLAPLAPARRAVPLLWFGLFEDCEIHEGAAAAGFLEACIAGRAYAGPLRHEWDAAGYAARFARVHDYIEDGDIYQANLSFRSRFAFAGDALALYRDLRAKSAAAHGAFIGDGERQILSLSPELFFELSADGRLAARPMKGTAARGADAASDRAARAWLASSPKDRAENLMIVDLLRNDLGRIAKLGSVAVPELFAVETYPTVHQMVSTVTAALKPGAGVDEIVRALFPCGSITGAPKIRAMEIIAELETSPRGIYCGAIGHFAPDGSARFNVAIRTLTLAGGAGELGIGGAVVQDSTAEAEYAECLLKARYYEAARRPLGLIETLRFSPRDGFVRRDLHLERLARSAAVFGIAFDRDAALRELNRLELSADTRVRLTVDERGALAIAVAPLAAAPSVWTWAISPVRVSSGDLLLRHKTTWRDERDGEQARLSRETGCDEAIFLNERGEVTEGSRSNIFLRRGGELLTPPVESGLLPGCLRRELLERGRCREAVLTPADLGADADVYFGNSLRGLVRAAPVSAVAVAAAR